MDLKSYRRWHQYSRARDIMLEKTDSKHAPWHIVRTDDKRRGRLNCISHILRLIPYKKVRRDKVKLPKRSDKGRYDDQSTLKGRNFVGEIYWETRTLNESALMAPRLAMQFRKQMENVAIGSGSHNVLLLVSAWIRQLLYYSPPALAGAPSAVSRLSSHRG